MVEDPPNEVESELDSNEKEFKFASKEGLIIVSLILFIIYSIWYKIFEFYYYDDKLVWIFIFSTFSLVVFITMTILLLTGIFVFWKDRKYLLTHEKYGGFIFIIGSVILFTIPLGWSFKIIEDQGAFALNSGILLIIGLVVCILGTLILARTGGFFTVWLIGIFIYLVMSFHESFKFIIWTGFFGPYDNFVGNIGIFVVVSSFILFLYHDLKFFYLSKIIKQGNKYRKERKYNNALACFNKTLRIYPLFTTAWNNMGNVYFNQGKVKEALSCYKKALQINPEYINARRNYEIVSKKAGRRV